jgi:hypothetical protein
MPSPQRSFLARSCQNSDPYSSHHCLHYIDFQTRDHGVLQKCLGQMSPKKLYHLCCSTLVLCRFLIATWGGLNLHRQRKLGLSCRWRRIPQWEKPEICIFCIKPKFFYLQHSFPFLRRPQHCIFNFDLRLYHLLLGLFQNFHENPPILLPTQYTISLLFASKNIAKTRVSR